MREGHIVYVITGPLYEKEMPKLPGADEEHRIPSGYFKIIIHQAQGNDPKTLQTAAFIFPQDTPGHAPLAGFLVTIDEVERRSGLDFLWELADGVESGIEGSLNASWVKEVFE